MNDRLTGLDTLRGIAALVVLYMHAIGFAGGHLAVDFFFMLSGFVMARTYEHRLASGKISATDFLLARFRRLWPWMAVGATLGLLVHLYAYGPTAAVALTYVGALTLLPISAVAPYLLNLPAWSIFYELLANALHGAIFAKLDTKRLWGLFGVAVAAFLAAYWLIGYPRILPATSLAMQVAVIFRALTAYLMGVLVFRLFGERPPVDVPLWAAAAMLPAYCVVVALYPFPGWPLPFFFLCGPLMLMTGIRSTGNNPASFLGDISFPLYAIHMPVLHLAGLLGAPHLAGAAVAVGIVSLWRAHTHIRPRVDMERSAA
ncbi:hypothetical protein M527_06975 [Sphingobium indicum IP26]|uniref:Acyltransferase 3 domain-containing protein n=1 Tax=Sphingobium indicum F2 TaxID=1450518 RepID=A0A8E0WSL3_9SPHN|nr:MULTISPECIES: acyltransferase [Sphingobium]EPR09863.1 hypothetical protein M527_06975 [Sphingobium indicum IP26]EQB04991.1 hypothetical protein L286_09490 [Sphingobium sp. HDIP04]KER36656.1 hypothetical protein AL00_09280 [Sphingobium indicum F2]